MLSLKAKAEEAAACNVRCQRSLQIEAAEKQQIGNDFCCSLTARVP